MQMIRIKVKVGKAHSERDSHSKNRGGKNEINNQNANSEAKMHWSMDQVSQSCDNYYLINSTKRQRLYTNQHMENHTMNQL